MCDHIHRVSVVVRLMMNMKRVEDSTVLSCASGVKGPTNGPWRRGGC